MTSVNKTLQTFTLLMIVVEFTSGIAFSFSNPKSVQYAMRRRRQLPAPPPCTAAGSFPHPDPQKYVKCVNVGGKWYQYIFICPTGSQYVPDVKMCIIGATAAPTTMEPTTMQSIDPTTSPSGTTTPVPTTDSPTTVQTSQATTSAEVPTSEASTTTEVPTTVVTTEATTVPSDTTTDAVTTVPSEATTDASATDSSDITTEAVTTVPSDPTGTPISQRNSH